jgi:hypothetical protein
MTTVEMDLMGNPRFESVCVCDGVVLGRSLTHVLWHRSGNDTTYNIINNILQHHQV